MTGITHRRSIPSGHDKRSGRPNVPNAVGSNFSGALICFGALTVSAGCSQPDEFRPLNSFEFGGPAGVLEGVVNYTGPQPCTEGGRIVGAAIILAFDKSLLPPPEGLGTTATSIGVVTGDQLFSGIRSQLSFFKSGRACPPPDAPQVTVAATWQLAPLAAGVYQVRGFYDRDGDFDPAFSISNLPSKGDIGGGAITNGAEVLQGNAPRYRDIELGALEADGTRIIPDTGSRVSGISVTLGLSLPLERPTFYVSQVVDETAPSKSKQNADPNHVVMPSDFALNKFSVTDLGATERSFIRLSLRAGVPSVEAKAAAAPPFFMAVDKAQFQISVQDVNSDGAFDKKDHVPDSNDLYSLYPLTIIHKT